MRLQVGPESYTVVGVAPEHFVGIGNADPVLNELTSRAAEPPSVFVPLAAFAFAAAGGRLNGWCSYVTSYCNEWLQMIVRRRPGVSPTVASSNLTAAFQRSYLVERSGDSAIDRLEWKQRLPPIPVARPWAIVGPVLAARGPMETATARVATWVAGVAAIVLLIACANVTNLLLASARERRGEIALRLALGVSQQRLIGQLLTECLILAGIGGVAALLVARLGGAVLTSMFLPTDTGAGLLGQGRTLLFSATATVLAGLMTSLVPALQARRTDVIDALKGGSRGGSSDRSRARVVLLLVQGALSVVLLVGAGLFIRSVEHVHAVRLGIDVDPILYAEVDLRGTQLDSAERRVLAERLIDAAKAVPGVADAARVLGAPLVGWVMTDVFVPGLGLINRLGDFTLQAVSPEYFHTAGTRILRGRAFTNTDAARAPRVVIVSESMANVLWPGQDALGKRIQIRIASDTMPYTTVVGIAENTTQDSLGDNLSLHYYLPFDQQRTDGGILELFIRTRGDARSYEATVQRVLQSLMPGAAYVDVKPMREVLDPQVRSWQLGAVMFLVFGGLALVVAAVGLYSVISYDVARRTHELGVRIALGARTRDVLRVVAADSGLFAAIGGVVGGAIALVAGPLIAPLLFTESPRDPVVFGAVVVVLGAAVIAATIGPVLRASRVDPATALRAE
jgi:predicted permease